jgi:hypothetical protein
MLNLYLPFSSPRLNNVRLVYNKRNQTIMQMTTCTFKASRKHLLRTFSADPNIN